MATRRRTATVVGATVAVLGVTALVSGLPGGVRPAQASGLTPFGSCDELTRSLREATLPLVTPWGLSDGGVSVGTLGGVPTMARGGREGVPSAGLAEDLSPSQGSPGSPGPAAVGSGTTGTNVQETGVDEPDLAKTDGRHVVTVSDGVLRVVDTDGGSPRLLGSVGLGHGASELLLVGDRALVLGSDPLAQPLADRVPEDSRTFAPEPWPTTRLTLVDLADPSDPRVLQTATLDGSYVSAREGDGTVRVVLVSRPRLAFPHPRYEGGAGVPGIPDGTSVPDGTSAPGGPKLQQDRVEQSALAANRETVRRASATDWLPAVTVRDGRGRVERQGPLMPCTALHHTVRPSGPGTVSVITVDPAEGLDDLPTTGVTADGSVVYASASRLYVATSRWPGLPVPLQGRPAPERRRPGTEVHAFDTTGDSAARYVASGAVDGWILGRWALSEHDGYLRVATTVSNDVFGPDTPATESQVVVLAEHGDRLDPVGRVGGLGQGEQIQAVRWFGPMATVVTFRQTDPLYTLDLSDPRRPRVLGELKIPGFSAYLHPLGGGLLLGIGQDADLSGRTQGMAASVFDLSDLANPRRLDSLALGAWWSPVMSESRAFTYLPDRRLAIVPVEGSVWTTRDAPGRGDDPTSSEPQVVPPSGDGVAPDSQPPAGQIMPIAPEQGGAVVLRVRSDGSLSVAEHLATDLAVQRVLPVGARLAAVSGNTVALYDAGTLLETGRLTL